MNVHQLEAWVKKATKITVIHFGLYSVIALIIGGDAVNGYTKNEHFFLRLGGYLTEVSYPLFLYSKIHTYILMTNYALLFLFLIYFFVVKGNKNNGVKFYRKTSKATYKHMNQKRKPPKPHAE